MRRLLFAICLQVLVGCSVVETSEQEPTTYAFDRVDLVSSLDGRRGFGSSIAVSDDWVFVSASSCRNTNEVDDAISVFKRTGDSWTEHQILTKPDGLEGFACHLATSGGLLAATVGYSDDQPSGVLIYHQEGAQWELLQELGPTSGRIQELALSGNRLAVAFTGLRVEIYELRDGTFQLEQTLTNPDESVRWFARTIDLGGDVLAVGAGRSGNNVVRALYIYERAAGTWELVFSEYRESGQESYLFASSLAVDEGRIIVGSQSSRDSQAEGGLELFDRQGRRQSIVGAFDSSGVDRGMAWLVDADEGRIVVTEEMAKRLRVFERYGGGYVELGTIANTLSDTAFNHGDLAINGRWIGVVNYFDRVATLYHLRPLD